MLDDPRFPEEAREEIVKGAAKHGLEPGTRGFVEYARGWVTGLFEHMDEQEAKNPNWLESH